jgi:hypothetical protein
VIEILKDWKMAELLQRSLWRGELFSMRGERGQGREGMRKGKRRRRYRKRWNRRRSGNPA